MKVIKDMKAITGMKVASTGLGLVTAGVQLVIAGVQLYSALKDAKTVRHSADDIDFSEVTSEN